MHDGIDDASDSDYKLAFSDELYDYWCENDCAGMVLRTHAMPWLLADALMGTYVGMTVSWLDKFSRRGRCENPRLRLVLSKIPRLAGLSHVFKDFYSWTEVRLLPARSDLVALMNELEDQYAENNYDSSSFTRFRASIESGPPGIEARGTMEGWRDSVHWAVARKNESGVAPTDEYFGDWGLRE